MTEQLLEARVPVEVPARGASTGGGRRRSLRRTDAAWAYLLIAPTAIGLGVFSIWPAIQTFYFSFTTWGTFGGNTWSGLENYTQVLADPELGRALLNTLIFSAMTMIGVPLSIALAALLTTKGLRGVGIYRTLYFLPVVTLPAAISLVWRVLYNGDFGVVNFVSGLVGGPRANWLSDPATAIYAVSVVSIWSSVGYNMVLFLAGMRSIPPEYYEAAAIDGAGRVRQFTRITIPLLTPTTFFVVVITVINSLQAFDLIYLMIGRTSPAISASQTVVYLFYDKGILQGQGGYAAAIAFVLLALILLLTLFQFRMQRRWVHYD